MLRPIGLAKAISKIGHDYKSFLANKINKVSYNLISFTGTLFF